MDASKIVTHMFNAGLYSTFTVKTDHYCFGKDEIESVTLYADNSSVVLLKNGGSLYTRGSIEVFARV